METLFNPLIDQTSIKLCFLISKNTPKFIVHDAQRIHQILVNLIGNAVKYTKAGIISIVIDWTCTTNELGTQVGMIRFTVSDSGQGISKEKRKKLFKFLGDAENNLGTDLSTTALAGTGLSICQKLANKLESEIEFISTVGIGSKFWFELEVVDFYVPKSKGEVQKCNSKLKNPHKLLIDEDIKSIDSFNSDLEKKVSVVSILSLNLNIYHEIILCFREIKIA